jgi:peroxiredoxin
MLSRRLVGESIGRTDLLDVDDDQVSYDLSRRGQTRVIGWFTLASCTGCARTFDRIADRISGRFKDRDAAPSVLAVTAPVGDLASYRKTFSTGVPLAVADDDVFDMLAMKDPQRITFMVIDCRGVVRYAAPVAPESDDVDAAIDEVLAAAEQAEHQRTVRR